MCVCEVRRWREEEEGGRGKERGRRGECLERDDIVRGGEGGEEGKVCLWRWSVGGRAGGGGKKEVE